MHSRSRTNVDGIRLRDGLIAGLAGVVFLAILAGYYYLKFQSEFHISPAGLRLIAGRYKPNPCDLIHIGMVCIKYESKLKMYTMLKSLFLYRKSNPIQFHIIVHKNLKPSLSRLFETWALPEVEVKFYDLKEADPDLVYIDSPSMLRFMLPIIKKFKEPNKMILLSTDILFHSDIFELWNEFQYFHKNQILGIPTDSMEDNERGFAEVALYHLDNSRKYGWKEMLKIVNEQRRFKFSVNTQMKKIFNYFAQSKLAYPIECSWNAMRSTDTECLLLHKVVHHEIIGQKDFVDLMKNFDGNAVRKRNYNCFVLPTEKKVKKPTIDQCSSFPESEIQQKRTLLYLFDYNENRALYSDVVTLVTAISFDQFHLLKDTAMRWKGPMSVTFYLTDEEFIKVIDLIESTYSLKDRLNTGYHVVFKYGRYFHSTYLRNVALNEVKTPYVFSTDMNVLPMENLYTVLKKQITNFSNMTKKALVVPVFQSSNVWSEIPSTKQDVLDIMEQNEVSSAQDLQEYSRLKGFSSADYSKWKNATNPYKVTWKNIYEPYVVVKSDVVRYDERFFAYEWDKISHIMELEAQGYEFFVLPNTFVVSETSKKSEDKAYVVYSAKYKMCLKSIKEKAAQDLKDKYGRTFLVD